MELFQERRIAGVSEPGIEVLSDKIKESGKLGVSGMLRYLLLALAESWLGRTEFLQGEGREFDLGKIGNQGA